MRVGRAPTRLISDLTIDQNIAMAAHKLTGLGSPADQDDSLRYGRAEIRNAEIAALAGIVYSKLVLTGLIVKGDIKAAAGIEYSKLALTGAIKAVDIEAAAGIPLTKLEAAVCSETEADNKITAHAGMSDAHHTPPATRIIATGTYNGNDGAVRQITTGFKCSCVILIHTVVSTGWIVIGEDIGIHLWGDGAYVETYTLQPNQALLHPTDGFIVDNSAVYSPNRTGATYKYWAISE